MRKLMSNISTKGRGLSLYDLRSLAQNEPEAFVHKIQTLVDDGKLKFSDFHDLRSLYAAFADVQVPVIMDIAGGTQRAIMASAFPILTGTAAIAAINDAYNAVSTIGQELVTEIEDPKKVTTIAAIEALDSEKDEVKDHEDFPEIGTTEEMVEIRHKQNGRILRIHQNMIDENEIADIVSRINKLGEIASDHIEEQTLKRVYDYDGSKSSPAEPYVYRPNGSGTALYSSSANTPGVRAPNGTEIQNNALEDESDLEACRQRLNGMKNSRGTRITIPWSEIAILVPDAKIGTLSKILNSEYVPGVENEKSNWGPGGRWNIPVGRVLSSPKCDDLSTGCWLMGAFKKQFRRKWKLRFEYVTLGTDTQAYLNSRIAAQFRIAWDCEVGAVDYVYCVRNLAATTAPADE